MPGVQHGPWNRWSPLVFRLGHIDHTRHQQDAIVDTFLAHGRKKSHVLTGVAKTAKGRCVEHQ